MPNMPVSTKGLEHLLVGEGSNLVLLYLPLFLNMAKNTVPIGINYFHKERTRMLQRSFPLDLLRI